MAYPLYIGSTPPLYRWGGALPRNFFLSSLFLSDNYRKVGLKIKHFFWTLGTKTAWSKFHANKKKTTSFEVVFVNPWLLSLCLCLGFRLGFSWCGHLRNLHSRSIIRFESCPNDVGFADSASF
jgi:hypothetical protein